MKRVFFIVIILGMIIATIRAQEFDLTFNNSESGTVTHTARNSITLGAGYYYTPSGGTLDIIIQDPVVTGTESYTTTPVDPEARPLNPNYQPGTTVGDLNIDPMGGASYSIPIEVQPGVNGLTPNLSLVYSGRIGRGIAGYGWYIDGLSSIERRSQNYFYDGTLMSDLTDRFYLDGQRLVTSTVPYMDPSAQYQTQNDIFSRVTPQNLDPYGPSWFKSETKSGLIYEYGNSPGSKEMSIGNLMGLNWPVTKISDLFGNVMNFAYFQDQSLPYLGEITYGSNAITFYYKIRIDKIVFYNKGTKMEQRLILDKITVKYNNTIVKTYELKYNFLYAWSNILQLNEVIEYGIGSNQYNSTAFTYFPSRDVSFSRTTTNTTHADISNKSKMIPLDFNGDGKTDFLCLPDSSKGATWTGKRVYSSNGDDNFSLLFSDANRIYLNKLKDIRSLDINGDGFDDILYETASGTTSYFYYILNNNGASFNSPVLINYIINNTPNYGFSGKGRRIDFQEDNELHGDDYNGDGINDILISTPLNQCWVYSFVGSSGVKSPYLNQISVVNHGGEEVFSADFNGDGKTDIWCLTNSFVEILSFDYASTTVLIDYAGLTTGSFFNVGDFNADGKADLFIYGTGKGGTPVNSTYWQTLLSTGTGFDPYLNGPKKSNLIQDYVRLGDFNDDGKTDIMATSSNQSWTGTYYFIAKNNGDDFNTYIMSSEPNSSNNFYLGDYNGDGNSDYITTIKQSSGVNGYKVFRTIADTAFYLNKVANGLGKLTKITYTRLTQAASTIYQKGTGATYPVKDFQGPLTVVSSVQEDNGKGSLNTHNFYYEGAKLHFQGKGFLGFAKIRNTDVTAAIESESISGYNTTYFYPQLLKTLSKRMGTTDTLEKVINTWSQVILDATTKRIFPYVQSSTQTNKLTGQKVTVTYQYDNYGNATSIVKSYLNGPTETSTYLYENITSPKWLLGRPTTITLQYTDNTTTITRNGSRVYDPNNNHYTTETWHSGTNNQVVHNYYYTPNGSLKREKVTANGQDRITTYIYCADSIRIATITDPLAHAVTSRYDIYGRLMSKTDYLNNKDSLTYDNMNRVINEYTTFGNQVTTSYLWEDPSIDPKLARYSVQKTGIDGAVKKSYFDKLGRETRNDVKGFDGTMIYTVTKYNVKGQVDSISDPYYSSGSVLWNRYIYDNYGRVTNLYRPSGRNSTWQYSNSNVTETTAGKSFTKTFSSDGTVASANDAGGTISYAYYPDGKVKTITAPGSIITSMQYDIAGNQTQLVDPSAGTITYTYDGFGQLTNQQNAKGQTTAITYYPDGRLNTKIQSVEGTTTYNYNSNKQLTSIVSPPSNKVKRRFVYDTKGRVTSMIDSIPGTSKFTTGFSYDIKGRLSTITHPSGIVETKNYNTFGYLSSVNAGGAVRWTTTGMNARQQVTTGKNGSNLNTTLGYDNYGYLTSKVTGTIEDYSYNFDPVSGNLNWRQNNKGSNLKENFYYDNLDRLDNIYMGTTMTLDMAYDGSKGVITTKTDAGTMLYNTSGKPYMVSNINPATSLTPSNAQTLTYTSFEKVSTISENNYNASFTYNSDDQRVKMDVLQGSSLVITRWYPTGSFMKDSVSGSTKLYSYIGGDAYSAPCVAIRQGTLTRYYYLLRDQLGNIIEISDSTNAKLYEYSYDAWGRMRNPSTWVNYTPGSEPVLFTGRGFTGHEHLPWFNLINMNGRVYDPLIGQFPSPDNINQNPGYSQNYNSYSFCFNNPLKYTDNSGYSVEDLLRNIYYDPLGHGQDQSYLGEGDVHYSRSNGYHSSNVMTQQDYDELRYSPHGGKWDEYSGLTFYENGVDALLAGCKYNVYHNSWGSTASGSTGASIIAYNNIISKQNLTASLYPVGLSAESSSLNGLKQYLAIVAGESSNADGEATSIGSVIKNRLELVCSSIIDDNFVSKIGGRKQYQAIGNDIYNEIMRSTWNDIFSSDNIFASRISGAITALLSDKDYSYGAYFWNANYQYFTNCIGTNWNEYDKGSFVITQQVGQTTFFRYTNFNQHWP